MSGSGGCQECAQAFVLLRRKLAQEETKNGQLLEELQNERAKAAKGHDAAHGTLDKGRISPHVFTLQISLSVRLTTSAAG